MRPEPVSIEEAYQVFLSILDIQGFTVVPQGPVIKIIPSADIKDSPIPIDTGTEGALQPTGGDAFITQLIPLKFADVNQIRGLVTPLVSKESSLLSYAPTNTLILTETASNIARLKTIIAALDVKASTKIFRVIPLQHADAGELAGAPCRWRCRVWPSRTPAPTFNRRRTRPSGDEGGASAAPRRGQDQRTVRPSLPMRGRTASF